MPKVLILIGGTERYHDLFAAASAFQDTLSRVGLPAVVSQDFSALPQGRVADYDVLVFYTQSPTFTKQEQQSLADYVASGKGFVPLHAANVIDEQAPVDQGLYAALVGSRLEGHAAFMRIPVSLEEDHPVTRGLEPFEIDDEPYVIQWVDQPARVLASGRWEGTDHPLVYTKEHGKGRICYVAFGHDGRAWYHPSFKKLLVQAVRWAGRA